VNHSDRTRGAARHTAVRLAAVFVLALLAAPAPAQTLAGRVVRSGAPASGVTVELHRVTRNTRGPVSTVTTGAAGDFSIALPPVQDTAGFTVFFATATTDGVRYFGPVVHGAAGDTNYRIEVFDTTTSRAVADSVRVTRRDVVMVAGSARRTLVPDATRPLFGIAIPKGSTAFQAGDGGPESDSPQAGASQNPGDVVRVGDRVWVAAPLVPGGRDLIFRYRLPASPRQAALPVEHTTDSVNVYVKQPAPEMEVAGLAKPKPYEAEGDNFLLFSGAQVRAGSSLGLDWRGPTPSPVDPRWAALALTGLVLAAGAWLGVRRGREPGARGA
jgi:hypothetical protein